VFMLPPVAAVWVGSVATYERAPFGLLFGAALVMLYLAIGFEFLKFLCLWERLKRLLHGLCPHPIVTSFVRLPAGPKPVIQFWPRLPRAEHLAIRGEGLILLAKEIPDLDERLFQEGNGSGSGPCYSASNSASNPGSGGSAQEAGQKCLKPVE